MAGLDPELRLKAEIAALTQEVVATSGITGQVLNPDAVRSCIARQLAHPGANRETDDPAVEGIVRVVLDAAKNPTEALTVKRLFNWHAALCPIGHPTEIGKWRRRAIGPMRVVSGDTVHFEALSAGRVPKEMRTFLQRFESEQNLDGILLAAVGLFWFLTIRPFRDGNGRIARAIALLALARTEASPHRLYSLAGAIRRRQANYYAALEEAQRGDLEITDWFRWFVGCVSDALEAAQADFQTVLRKEEASDAAMSRQR